MGDSDGVPYDDDFEEASDDELRRSMTVLDDQIETSLSVNCTVSAPPRLPRRHRKGDSHQGSPSEDQRRPRPVDPLVPVGSLDEKAPSFFKDPFDSARTGSAGSSASQPRVVRGKVSVSGHDPDMERRAQVQVHNGESQPTTAAAQASSKPVWLQFNNAGAPPRHTDLAQNAAVSRPQSGPRRPNRDRDNALELPIAPRPPLSGRSMVSECDGERAGDDRQVKRLQQEIQRLTQRLNEAELFSSQDDLVPKFALEEVEVGCMIAQGGFSSVHHATWRCTTCALKKIFDPIITDELRSEFENEVRMLRLLRHPHIVGLMAVCRVPPALSVLTEYVAGGSIHELLHGAPSQRQRGGIEPEASVVFPVALQAAGALAYMHSMMVVHRDIKSHNVLLTAGSHPVAKLCDFGLARFRSELCTGTLQWAGTPAYMAPELFAKKRYGDAVDVFAFGILIWEVASMDIPHANLDPSDIAHRVQKQDGACLPVSHSWSKSLKKLIRCALAVQPEGRPTMVEVSGQLETITSELPLQD